MKPRHLIIEIETNFKEYETKIDNVKNAYENLKIAIKELDEFVLTLTPSNLRRVKNETN